MKRPVCICCVITLAVQLACALLPQAAFWLPAAFCVVAGAALLFVKKYHAMGICLCLGGLLGGLLFGATLALQFIPAQRRLGQTADVAAKVLSTDNSYADGMVSADLQVFAVNGKTEHYRIRCTCLPYCTPGQRIEARFALEGMEKGRWQRAAYADGVFAQAEYIGAFAAAPGTGSLRGAFYALQTALSSNIRYYLRRDVGGILAAMTVGDKRFIGDAQYASYQKAGIPHVLAVSGLHLSLLCGLLPLQKRKWRSRMLHALGGIAAACFLMGVTGGSPSILRAGIAVLIMDIGILLGYPADSLTSLAVSGVLLSAGNAYMVFDIAFELSFAATAGVLASSGMMRRWWRAHPPEGLRGALRKKLADTFAVSGMAALCTMPVLVLQGMNVSLVSVLTNAATLWLMAPILICGFGAAFSGFLPQTRFLLHGFALAGGALVQVLNGCAAVFGAFPAASCHAQSGYPAAVFFLLGAFLLTGYYAAKLPLRRLLPVAAGLLCFSWFLGVRLSSDLIKIAMLGNSRSPAVVATQNGHAAVLFRGGAYNSRAVEAYLQDAGIGKIDLLIDLRLEPETACALEANTVCRLSECEAGEHHFFSLGDLQIETKVYSDSATVMLFGGRFFAGTAIGTPDKDAAPLDVDVLLGASSPPGAFSAAKSALCLSQNYSWLDSSGIKTVYYGEQGAAVWLRPGKRGANWPVRFTGVIECRRNNTKSSPRAAARCSVFTPRSPILSGRRPQRPVPRCLQAKAKRRFWMRRRPLWRQLFWPRAQSPFSAQSG